jgi:cytoskeleton protein RodZ
MINTTNNPVSSEKHQIDLSTTESDLKSIRESKGLTLKDIFERTRISVMNLDAIESDKFNFLPPPVITKSFIKIYSKALGVDSSIHLARYEQYLETLKPAHRDDEIEKSVTSSRGNRSISLWVLFIFITAGIIIFALSSYNANIEPMKNQIGEPSQNTPIVNPADDIKTHVKNEGADQTIPASKIQDKDVPAALPGSPAQPPAQKAEDKPKAERSAASPAIISKQKEIAETYQLTIEAREPTWLRIRADQSSPSDILMKPGEKIRKSASHFIIDVGNAGGIDIDFQGKSLGPLGKQGQVVHLRLP